jgi:predicted CoA-binding protein
LSLCRPLCDKKPAFAIAEKLRQAGKDVVVVNPRETEGRCFTSLKDCPQPIDVVDLVIR